MKNLKLTSRVIVVGLILASCNPKKESQQESFDAEAVDSKTEQQPSVRIFASVDSTVKKGMNDLLENYFGITGALADDNVEKATAATREFKDRLVKFDRSKLKDEQIDFFSRQAAKLSEALKRIETSVDIEEIRTETALISDDMYLLVKAFGGNGSAIYYDYCPMARNNAGAHWLSDVDEIKNPYMGQSMPTCGTTKEVLK